jgi:hypothetical protein
MRKLFRKLGFVAILLTVALGCSKEEPAPKVNPSVVYFLVAERNSNRGESYILPLYKADDIAQARGMIARPSEQKIVVAEITRDKNVNYHINKDLLQNKKWSWHVASFLGFADMTIEIYDGWPQYVEDDFAGWTEITKGDNGNGRIGFWGYSIKREVSASELQ